MHVMAGAVLIYAIFMLLFFTCGNLVTGQKFSIQESIKLEKAIKALQLEGAGSAGKMGIGMGIDMGKKGIRLLERELQKVSVSAASFLSLQSRASTPRKSIEKNGAAENQANQLVPKSIEEETFESLHTYKTD